MSSYQLATPEVAVNGFDPNNFPRPDADGKLLELWNMHGHLYSSRYTNPDITSLSSLLRINAKSHGEVIAYLVPSGNAMTAYHKVNYQELDGLVTKAAVLYSHTFTREIAHANDMNKQPTIAMVGVGITFDYFITIMALLRLHIRVLLLSNKNPKSAHEYLLKKCDATGCIVDTANKDLIGKIESFYQSSVPLVNVHDLEHERMSDIPTGGSMLGFKTDDEWNLHSVIIHSSGTTGMPKPIVHTNRSICLIARHHRLFRDFYIENYQICAPLFHIGGFSVAIGGLPIAATGTFPPPDWPPATSAILTGWKTLESIGHPVDAAQIAPALVEDIYTYISLTTNDFEPLSRLKVLQSGGAPFAPALLEKLVAHGVNMKTIYGQTEIAGPMRTLPHGRENPHMARLRNLYDGTGWVVMKDLGAGDGSAECVVYRDFPLAAQLWDMPDAPNPYRTNDVLREDPPGSGFWVLLGRKDDVVVHSNGEKTMAGAVATALQGSSPIILSAAVYGAGRPCTAAILGLRWSALTDADSMDAAHVEELVWSAIQCVNEQIPTHSRIDRSLVLVLGRDEELPVTPKRTVKRKVAWEMYGSRLDRLFDKFLGGEQQTELGESATIHDRALPLSGTSNLSDEDYVRFCVNTACSVPSDGDIGSQTFYEIGLNSQRAVQLRALLLKRFPPFPLMFIFENPTLHQLTTYLKDTKAPKVSENRADAITVNVSSEHAKFDCIQAMVERCCTKINGWKKDCPIPDYQPVECPSTDDGNQGEVIYLTGANGALGNALLEVFSLDSTVTKIYCAIRGSQATVQEKLRKSLKSRGYDIGITNNPKLCAVPFDMSDEKLGLDDTLFHKLQMEVTTVINNAWRLDFNKPVTTFETDCLTGLMNTLRFCITGRKKLAVFTSSISTVMGPAMAGKPILEAPVGSNPGTPSSTGYAQSKYVAERATQYYAERLGMPVCLLRVGQLCGHTKLGVWNESEMWPIMIATGLVHLHAMPVFPGVPRQINWLPVDACARAAGKAISSAATIRNGKRFEQYTVHNLVNPHTVSWCTFLDMLETASTSYFGKPPFARIPIAEWTQALEKMAENGDSVTLNVPGLKLLGYFQAMAVQAGGEQSEIHINSVAEEKLLDAAAIRKWLEKWQESGFLRG